MSHFSIKAIHRYWDPRYVIVALFAAAIDLGTKQAAWSYLGERVVSVSDRFGLMLVFNTGGAGGYSIGPATWYVNVLITAGAILTMCAIAADLGRFHRLGAIALGLVTGGAVGNLASMLGGPEGVADFLAWHLEERSIVFNVADLALWTGALLLTPVVLHLVRAIRAERAAVVSPRGAAAKGVRTA